MYRSLTSQVGDEDEAIQEHVFPFLPRISSFMANSHFVLFWLNCSTSTPMTRRWRRWRHPPTIPHRHSMDFSHGRLLYYYSLSTPDSSSNGMEPFLALLLSSRCRTEEQWGQQYGLPHHPSAVSYSYSTRSASSSSDPLFHPLFPSVTGGSSINSNHLLGEGVYPLLLIWLNLSLSVT